MTLPFVAAGFALVRLGQPADREDSPERRRANLARRADFADVGGPAVRASDARGHRLTAVYASVSFGRDLLPTSLARYESHLASSLQMRLARSRTSPVKKMTRRQ